MAATFLQKAKLWIWNSSKTWRAGPLLILQIPMTLLVLIALFACAIVALVGFVVGAIIGSVLSIIPGMKSEDTVPAVAVFFAMLFGGLLAVATLGPLLVVGFILSAVVHLVFGFVGGLIGVLTSFLVALGVEPTQHWLMREQEETQMLMELRSQQANLEAQTRELKALADSGEQEVQVELAAVEPLQKVFSAMVDFLGWLKGVGRVAFNPVGGADPIPEQFLRFADFNPNVETCIQDLKLDAQITIRFNSERNREVVKASDNQYYYRDQLDAAHKAGLHTGITYDEARDILPNPLLRKLREDEECSITGGAITREDGVRTIHGHYFTREGLSQWLATHNSCPMRSGFLTMRYVSGIAERLQVPAPQPGGSLGVEIPQVHRGGHHGPVLPYQLQDGPGRDINRELKEMFLRQSGPPRPPSHRPDSAPPPGSSHRSGF